MNLADRERGPQPKREQPDLGKWENVFLQRPLVEDVEEWKRTLESRNHTPFTQTWVLCAEEKLAPIVEYVQKRLGVPAARCYKNHDSSRRAGSLPSAI